MKISKGLATWAGVIAAAGTLLVVVAGRMGQAIGLAVKTPKPAATPPVTFGAVGGTTGVNTTGFVSISGARAAEGLPDVDTLDEPGDLDALPDYATDENVPPDTGDTSANGDVGEREA